MSRLRQRNNVGQRSVERREREREREDESGGGQARQAPASKLRRANCESLRSAPNVARSTRGKQRVHFSRLPAFI